MKDIPWEEVEKVFEKTCNLPAAERPRFLEETCRDNPKLRTEVESLLRADEKVGNRLEDLVVREGFCADEIPEGIITVDQSRVGQTFGFYRLTELIDSGGMGVVYSAVRDDDEYKKRVAVKLIKGGMITEENLQRFLRERQALANLDHPNIARLLDGGTNEEGQPYLVMDFIDGEPIDDWCDARRLSTAHRLKLFRTVCAAVHHAHKNLIIHRDIKPANILVTADGVPKLLDFGIAKILESEAAVTLTTQRVLTPEYASPEQIQGKSITTASDIYSLGVVLYQLLTGRKPFEAGTGPAHELARKVCEEDPPRPSSVVKGASTKVGSGEQRDAEMAAHMRGATPDRLRRLLSGELNAITLMALRKEPERRFASVEQLSSDILSHLDGLPVSAHSDTFFYRGLKFARRNRSVVGGLTLLLVILLWGIYSTTKEADKAQRQAQAARDVRASWVQLLRSFDPYGEDREALSKEAEGLIRALKNQPREKAELMESVAAVFEDAYLYKSAVRWRERALKAWRNELPEEKEKIAHAHFMLGYTLQRGWKSAEAEKHLREAWELQEQAEDPNTQAIAQTERILATSLWNQGDFDSPLILFERALGRLNKNNGTNQSERIVAMTDFAAFLGALGDSKRGEEILLEALEIIDETKPDDPLIKSNVYHRLGMLLRNTPAFAEAERHVRRALAILHESNVPLGDPAMIACRSDLALLISERFKSPSKSPATQICRECLNLREKIFGQQSMEYANTCLNLARVVGRGTEMKIYIEKTLKLYGRIGNEQPLLEARAMALLGESFTIYGIYPDEAIVYLKEALAVLQKMLPRDHWETAHLKGWLGAALAKKSRFREGEALMNESYQVLSATHGVRHPRTGKILRQMVNLYKAWRKDEHANTLRKLLEAENRKWPFYPHYRDDDGSVENWRCIGYDDDSMEKTIELPVDPKGADFARLWIYGYVYHWPGQQYRKEAFHHIMVNGSLDQDISFDLALPFDYLSGVSFTENRPNEVPVYHWAFIEIPVNFLKKGANTFLIYEDQDYATSDATPREWEYNNLLVGIDTDSDKNRSWWHNDVQSGYGEPMANFFNDQLLGEGMGEGENRITVREMWRRSQKKHSHETIKNARQQAVEQCEGELMIFLELAYKQDFK